jgi:hypothetical protein
MRAKADKWAIAAAILGAISSLGVWATLADSTKLWAIVIVSLVSIATTLVGSIPKIKLWAECAGAAPLIASKYGHAIGELENAREALAAGLPEAQKLAEAARSYFAAARNEKLALKPFPSDLQAARDKQKANPA